MPKSFPDYLKTVWFWGRWNKDWRNFWAEQRIGLVMEWGWNPYTRWTLFSCERASFLAGNRPLRFSGAYDKARMLRKAVPAKHPQGLNSAAHGPAFVPFFVWFCGPPLWNIVRHIIYILSPAPLSDFFIVAITFGHIWVLVNNCCVNIDDKVKLSA